MYPMNGKNLFNNGVIMKKLIAVSGGFDPIHIGHIKMIRDAVQHGDVVVILNSDDWLVRKRIQIYEL